MNEEKDLYKNLTPYLNCIDYTVSNESYEVMYNEQLDMLVTSPLPKDLHNYYKSDNYISHTDSKKSLIDKIYQIVKKYSLNKKLKLINSFNSKNKTLLDIGAGTGHFINVCHQNGWTVNGVEPSEDARAIAKKNGTHLNESIEQLSGKKYDVISLWHVLEHVTNIHEYIKDIKKLLTENGTLIIAVPNYKSYDANYYKQYWAAYDVPRHVWHFSKKSIHKIFNFHHMKVSKILPMKFDSFYVSLLSEKYKTGKMNPFKAFYIGLKSNLKAKTENNYSSLIFLIKKQ
ncbi:Methyltransferase domain-containing protein [Tenacibaculum sp. MAR_2009_124]|uniref:class I SAM-dependent methyltransferase n=1 Tax=Tenacibaculum sp. MAR_2009_124 TaxID=1250059 RepID=UPI000897321A|nr:class I SAM-dependent methyltransferase [Tenacibaculum sp. MAR_2009_124]SEC42583.1 Methyltransferase domain-containing protein [Tenacibaculum sp. MAR_2009_124]